jgi:hypothetical protein
MTNNNDFKKSDLPYEGRQKELLQHEIRKGIEAFERGDFRESDESLAEEIHKRGMERLRLRGNSQRNKPLSFTLPKMAQKIGDY